MDCSIGLPHQYKVERLLAQAPHSLVYLVHRADGAVVVLKELDISIYNTDPQVVVRNITALSTKLKHQNLVACHNCVTNEATKYAYLELDFCSGGSLADLFRKQRRTTQGTAISQVWSTAAQLLSALSYLHFSYKRSGEANCITHGHITPDAVLFGPNGSAYLNLYTTSRIIGQEHDESSISLTEKCRKDISDLGLIFTRMLGITPQEIHTCKILQNEPNLRCFLEACCGLDNSGYTSAAELLLFEEIQAALRTKSHASSRHTSSTSNKIPGRSWPHSSLFSRSDSNVVPLEKTDYFPTNKNTGTYPASQSAPVEDGCKETSLIQAVCSNDRRLVQQNLDQLGGHNSVGCTALMFAAAYGYHTCIDLLLDEVGLQDANGWTALMTAAQQGKTECVRLLVKRESCLSDMNGFTALMAAAVNGRVACVELLLEHERGLRYVDGRTALMWAAFVGELECVKVLLPAEKNEKDSVGNSVLIWAHRGGNLEVLDYIRDILDQPTRS